MQFIKKNYLFCILSVLIIFTHQAIFQNLLPNSSSFLGHDYSLVLPNFLFGKIWFDKNFLSIPWFSPSFCCGVPYFADPQIGYYSFQQLLFVFFPPLIALKISFFIFSLTAFIGMFLLAHKSFKLNIYISLIAATLFLFNGFFNYRAIIGHFSFLSYVFIPLYCFTLICSFEDSSQKLKNIFYILISSILFANFIHSGSSSLIVVITFSIALIILIYVLINNNLKIIYNLLLSLFLGLIISSSKINASFAFLSNFTREYPPLLFENFTSLLINTVKSLFFFPDINRFNSDTINQVTTQLQVHEIEFGVSIVPIIIFVFLIFNIKNFLINNFSIVKFISFILALIILIFAVSINLSSSEIGGFLRELPVIKSTWVHFRITSIYIIPIILISTILLSKINLKFNYLKYLTFVFLFIIIFQNQIYEKKFYNEQKYDPKNIVEFYKDKNRIKNINVNEIIIFLDQNNKPVISNQRNDMFVFNYSPLFCYNPIFGYNLEKLPKNKFTFNKKNKINSNLINYTGNPKGIKGNQSNFFNPSCFVFPDENGCKPGDFFKENQMNDLENFLNYKNFNFQVSKSQTLFNFISLISFLMSILFIIYYLIRKIIFKY